MAGRSHVDVNERRLRPVYDYLDNGNNKKALHEVDKVLKKQKDFVCAKALKALALLRLGRSDESKTLLEDVHNQHPTDDATLQAMAISYKETHRLDAMASMYHNAHKQRPENEEFLSALFMAYVRLGDYQKQKQTALTLHKVKPHKNPYYFWAVMSIVMQAQNDEKLGKTMLLPLAKKMIKKYVDEDKMEAEAEVQLYLLVLELLQKHEEALEVIQGPLSARLTGDAAGPLVKEAQILKSLKRWPETNAAYRKLLCDNPDHWQCWKDYLSSLLQLIDDGWQPQVEPEQEEDRDQIDYTVDMALSFISEKISESESGSGRLLRGPFLAKMEFYNLLKARNSPDADKVGNLVDLLRDFYQRFGDKFCCFNDMKLYIYCIEPHESAQLLTSLMDEWKPITEEGDARLPQDAKEMQRHISLVQLYRYTSLDQKLDEEQKQAMAKQLLLRHKHGLDFGADLWSTDYQFSDMYILLAAYTALDLWKQTGKCRWLWRCARMLERGRKFSPSNHQIKLLLIKVYCTLGAFGPCPSLYDSMDVKHIQNDSIGYVMSSHVRRLGHFSSAVHIYGVMLGFFTVNYKDTSEYLISAYKYGSFFKILEFVKFRHRLQNSIQFAMATSERLLLDLTLETTSHLNTEQLVNYADIDPVKDKTAWDELTDNRDLTVMVSMDPPERCITQEMIDNSFQEEKSWLRVCSLTIQIIAASVQLGQGGKKTTNHNTSNGDARSAEPLLTETLESLSLQLQEKLSECSKCQKSIQYPIQGPFRTRLPLYLHHHYGEILVSMINIILYLSRLQDNGIDKTEAGYEESLKCTFVKQFKDTVLNQDYVFIRETESDKTFCADAIERIILAIEILAQVTALTGVCHKLLKPIKAFVTKRHKKKKDPNLVLPQTFSHYSELNQGLCELSQELKNFVDEMETQVLAIELQELSLDDQDAVDPDDKSGEEVWEKAKASYTQTFKESRDLISNKLQYLKTIKL